MKRLLSYMVFLILLLTLESEHTGRMDRDLQLVGSLCMNDARMEVRKSFRAAGR